MEPKFKYEDKVLIEVNWIPKQEVRPVGPYGPLEEPPKPIRKTMHGVIYIIDRNGTWDNGNREPSYDVYVEEQNMLYKHISESQIRPDEGGETE